ncbi:SVEP1-like protein [Mya arenaria]|uniref:SVEP1-like protein n=1 Tax=Mya arenaria TaxID=6604 RepID=A0ABY7FUE7_MYAAR|nr:SVEP1-like protein [Mya arenaria]
MSKRLCSYVRNGYYLSENKPVRADTLLYFKTIIQPYCHTGYLLTRRENLTCQMDGQFSRRNSECRSVTCSSFGELENGILHYSDVSYKYVDRYTYYSVGVKVRASCDSGFQLLHGSKEQTCLENGTWDGVKPVCSKIRCNDTSILSVRFEQSSSVFSFLERGTASYNSSIFYLVNGNLSFICLANGSLSWEVQPPELGDDAALSRSNSCITTVVTDGNYYESVSPYEFVE